MAKKTKYQNGAYVSIDQARNYIKAYRVLSGANSVRGYIFDVALLRSFLDQVDQLGQIPCIRIYQARSSRRGHRNVKDLVMVPMKDEYNDYYTVDKNVQDPTIIAESTPCPNLCGVVEAIYCPPAISSTTKKSRTRKKK